ncbi:DUF222 domain-containing protein [Prauserella aidingensis]|uniref:DUF222 domain-containing protein n=1 Tax=Prauserella aidingensis TaxID=387890 RepID=UPI0035569024
MAERLVEAPETAWQAGNLAQRVRRLVEKVDPGGQTERARRARAERRVELTPGEHVMSSFEAHLPAEVAGACYTRVDGMARSLRRDGHGRTLDQLRADVTADLLLGRDPGAAAPEAAAMVYVHVPADAALSISDEGCELDGYGPIPAPIAREIMTNTRSSWRAVLCDPGTGDPVDLGRTRRRPSATIRDLVRVRDRECIMPWCHRPARHCDHDHEHPWATTGAGGGGSTSAANGGPRCRRHHRLKDRPGWNTRYDPVHGVTRVTTPHGSTYTAHRRPVLTPKHPTPTRDTTARTAPADNGTAGHGRTGRPPARAEARTHRPGTPQQRQPTVQPLRTELSE